MRTQVAIEEEPVTMFDDINIIIDDCLKEAVKDGLAW